jgi:hypothetical protein
MVWFTIDDSFGTSPKVMSIPRDIRLQAVGLWTLAGNWSARQLTDGRVPRFMLPEFGAEVSHGTALVDAGLWRVEGDDYVFHDWSDYQQTRTQVHARRESDRKRKEEWRAKRAENKAKSHDDVPSPVTEESRVTDADVPSIPTQTLSLPKPKPISNREGGARKRGTRIPDKFIVTADMRKWAAEKVPGVDVDRATEAFCDYWRSESGARASKLDWESTWRNWLRRDAGIPRIGQKTTSPIPSGDEWMFNR